MLSAWELVWAVGRRGLVLVAGLSMSVCKYVYAYV